MNKLLAVVFVVSCAAFTPGAQAQPFNPLRRAEQDQKAALLALRQAFRPVVVAASNSTVAVRSQGKELSLGTIVGEDGWILTKASELSGPKLTVRLKDNRELEATVMGVVEEHDLAMLKVKAKGLKPVVWARESEQLELGQWLATVAPAELPVSVGVVSVQRRKIPSRNAMLGVALADGEGGVRVMQVVPESGADKAGIQPDDLIVELNGQAAKTRDQLVEMLAEQFLGSSVIVKVRRRGEEIDITATLGKRIGNERAERMDNMGGPLSQRNQGFPIAFQHDTVLKPNECGGPVVNLDGKVVGINIARAGRTESYAIPADVLPKLVADLRAGKYATSTRPAGNNQQK